MPSKKQPQATAMALAFVECAGKNPRLVRHVATALHRGAGIRQVRGVDAHLSYRTAQKLKQQGIIE